MLDKTPSPTAEKFSTNNYILNNISEEELNRLIPDFEKVDFELGDVLYRAESNIEYLYFPQHLMISMIATTSEGQSAEIGVIGSEGIVGVNYLLGTKISMTDIIIQIANGAFRINVSAAEKEFKRGGKFQELILHFAHLMMMQIGQTALCNRLHTVEERLARWLLMCRDRSKNDELNLTQEFLGIMLGANRATVTLSAINLQSAGFITYSRGKIIIIDREGLENFCCECYEMVKKEYDRIMNQ